MNASIVRIDTQLPGEHPVTKLTAWSGIANQRGSGSGYSISGVVDVRFVGRTCAVIRQLFVCPQHRRQGIGRALIEKCAEIAMEGGCECLSLLVRHANPDAQKFYSSLGFIYAYEDAEDYIMCRALPHAPDQSAPVGEAAGKHPNYRAAQARHPSRKRPGHSRRHLHFRRLRPWK